MTPDWLRYSNQGAIRSKPISGGLLDALSFLPDLGIQMEVFSGGQAPKGSGGPRTGSTRHDHGNAADVFFYRDGRKLDWNNPADVPIFQSIVKQARANGVTGIGAGDGYMQPGSMHIGFGKEAVWGAGGKGANAPNWLSEAYHGHPNHIHQNQGIADQTMAAPGKQPMRPKPVAGGAAVQTAYGGPSQDTLQGAQMQPNQQPTGLLGRMFPNMEEEQRERIRYGLANLGSLSVVGPNARVMDQIDKRRDTRAQDAKLNHTIEWLAKQPGGEKFAQAAAAGIPVNQAFNAYRQEMQAANDPSVQSSTSLPDMSGSVVTMRDGSQSVITAGGERLTGQEAMDFVARAQQAYTDQQRSVYGARRGGSLEADIELGGDAERAKQEGKMAPVTAKEFSQNASVIRSSIVNMDDALSALDRGANSGVVYKMLPAVSEASASLRNSMNRLGLDVIGSVTFGALSQAEMQLAMETAVPRNLEPEALRDWLTRKRAAQVKAYQAAMEAAQHFASGGTQADYYASIGLPPAPQPSAPGTGGPQTQMPDLTQMSDEQLQAIIDGGQP